MGKIEVYWPPDKPNYHPEILMGENDEYPPIDYLEIPCVICEGVTVKVPFMPGKENDLFENRVTEFIQNYMTGQHNHGEVSNGNKHPRPNENYDNEKKCFLFDFDI